MKNNLFVLFFLLPVYIVAQHQLKGLILDNKTKKPLPYATIIINNNQGSITDKDGSFLIESKTDIISIKVSYVGYKTAVIKRPSFSKYITITLEPTRVSLDEVVLGKKTNPAVRIIKNAILNKRINDVNNVVKTYQYTTYNKLLITANTDSINPKIDSVFKIKKGIRDFVKLDSTNYKFKKELSRRNLYISEKISKIKYIKNKGTQQYILASRMAGLKRPIYEIVAMQLQSFSFYKNKYSLLGNNYINPLASNAMNYYDYKLLNKTIYKNDTTFMVYFKPRKLKTEVGLEGVLYINSHHFAIEKGIIELKGIANVKAIQTYKYDIKHRLWFPKNKSILIKKGKNDKNMNFFGGKISFETDAKKDSATSNKRPEDVTYLLSKSENFDILINSPLQIRKSLPSIIFKNDATTKSVAFWKKYRTDSISQKDKNTYKVLDSIVAKKKLEQKIRIGRNLLKGLYHTSYVDLDLSKVILYNNYEGIRVGIGFISNNSLSKRFKIDTYTAYGIKDHTLKYHAGISSKLIKDSNTWLGFSYTDDVYEAAHLHFIDDKAAFSPINPRNLNIGQFYNSKTYNAYLKHDIRPNLTANLDLSSGLYNPKFLYVYISPTKILTSYHLTLATLKFQWNPFSKYMQSPVGKLKTVNGYPQITAQLTKSVPTFLGGDFNYIKFNLRIIHKIKIISNGITNLLLRAGYISNAAPLPQLFNATPNFKLQNPWRKRINLAGRNAFETMSFNEFISDKFVSLQVKHNFRDLKLGAKFRPQFTLVSRFAIGTLGHKLYHHDVSFKTMEKGYYESGFELNNLFKGFGLSSFYRYGSYRYHNFSDNITLKITFHFNFSL